VHRARCVPDNMVSKYLIFVVPCDELPQPEHGSVMCTYGDDVTTSYQDVCQYSCVDGFELIGNSSRTCLSTGIWSNDDPVCRRGTCGEAPLIIK